MISTNQLYNSLAGAKRKSRKATNANSKLADPNAAIKLGIWAYFFLLILEGTLRKWVLPGLATPLLVVRDPIVIWVLYLAASKGLLKANKYMVGMVIIGLFGLLMAMVVGHKNLAVAIFGARILVLHFPFIFVMGRVFNREDVIKMGRVIVYMSIPMAILIALQFYSPQSAWVNRGVGDDIEGAGFTGALGYFSTPGYLFFYKWNHTLLRLGSGLHCLLLA